MKIAITPASPVAQRREVEPVLHSIEAQIMFGDHLGDRIGRGGLLRRCIGDRQGRRLAVRCAARGEDNFSDSALDRAVEDVDQSYDVDVGIEPRIARADRDRMLRGVMAHDFRRELAKDALDAFVTDVEVDERGVLRDVFATAAAVRP
jgi:hypothetical protein